MATSRKAAVNLNQSACRMAGPRAVLHFRRRPAGPAVGRSQTSEQRGREHTRLRRMSVVGASKRDWPSRYRPWNPPRLASQRARRPIAFSSEFPIAGHQQPCASRQNRYNDLRACAVWWHRFFITKPLAENSTQPYKPLHNWDYHSHKHS